MPVGPAGGLITTIGGGVGAAKLLRGLVETVDPKHCTAIINTADDFRLHGLVICPDLDTCTYTLADTINTETGWGMADETWNTMGALERYGGITWFRLGDKDIATHLYRTHRLVQGADLATITAEITAAWGLEIAIVPMSNQAVQTRIMTAEHGEISFQEYFVARRHDVPITGVRFRGIDVATPGPGVLESLHSAQTIVVAPSNPIVSVGPVLAVRGVRDALVGRRDRTVAISPIVGGRALKGPAQRMLTELGHQASVVGVAHLYADFVGTMVIDHADADLADDVRVLGMDCVVTETIMSDAADAARLASVVLGAMK